VTRDIRLPVEVVAKPPALDIDEVLEHACDTRGGRPKATGGQVPVKAADLAQCLAAIPIQVRLEKLAL
jgi:hypothetical protein